MPEQPPNIRLNKLLSANLKISRRSADQIIEAGRVKINSTIAKLGDRVSSHDKVSLNNQLLEQKKIEPIYLLLNKPTSIVCSRKSQNRATKTIYDILPKGYRHLNSVGRLDKNSSGLILLTNDGDFAHHMTHPSFKKTKRYLVAIDKDLQPLHHQMINDFGVKLPDGPSKLTLTRQHESDSKRWVVEMSEGRNRQIRRTFEALGYTVKKLHRTNFGDYSLGDIKPGQWQILNTP